MERSAANIRVLYRWRPSDRVRTAMSQGKSAATAVRALRSEYETVFYSKGRLAFGREPGALSRQDADALRAPFAALEGALDSLEDTVAESIRGDADEVLVGARAFRPPAGTTRLGSVQADFSYLLLFEKRTPPDPTKDLSGEEAGLLQNEAIREVAVAAQESQQSHRVFVGRVLPSHLVVARSVDELRAVAVGLRSSGIQAEASVRLAGGVPLEGYDFWGHRRYRHVGVEDAVAAGTSDITASAEALAFFLDSHKKTGHLVLFASDRSAADMLNSAMANGNQDFPVLQPSGEATWSASFRFMDDDTTRERVFMVMGLFGFGVYL